MRGTTPWSPRVAGPKGRLSRSTGSAPGTGRMINSARVEPRMEMMKIASTTHLPGMPRGPRSDVLGPLPALTPYSSDPRAAAVADRLPAFLRVVFFFAPPVPLAFFGSSRGMESSGSVPYPSAGLPVILETSS